MLKDVDDEVNSLKIILFWVRSLKSVVASE